jgi:hypothetical protein
MFLQRLQLSKYGYFYSTQSWWRWSTGFGSWTTTYYKLLKKNYILVMGDLLSKPADIIKRLEEDFPKKIKSLTEIVGELTDEGVEETKGADAGDAADADIDIGELIDGINEVWNIVKEI